MLQGLNIPATVTVACSCPQGSHSPPSFSPQSLDLAEYNVLFVLSFTTPAFDSDVAPSFGTLLATVNVALNMLGEVRAVCVWESTALAVVLENLINILRSSFCMCCVQ